MPYAFFFRYMSHFRNIKLVKTNIAEATTMSTLVVASIFFYLIFSIQIFLNCILQPSACKAIAPFVVEQLVAVF